MFSIKSRLIVLYCTFKSHHPYISLLTVKFNYHHSASCIIFPFKSVFLLVHVHSRFFHFFMGLSPLPIISFSSLCLALTSRINLKLQFSHKPSVQPKTRFLNLPYVEMCKKSKLLTGDLRT